jgi:hypothetical protein
VLSLIRLDQPLSRELRQLLVDGAESMIIPAEDEAVPRRLCAKLRHKITLTSPTVGPLPHTCRRS